MKNLILIAFLLIVSWQSTVRGAVGPGWQTAEEVSAETTSSETEQGISLLESKSGGEAMMMLMGGEPVIAEEITPEITALANGLGNDPKMIYDYVRNHIRYTHYFGSKKGAHVTLLEQSGGEFDQCALLVALLRAAADNSGATYTVSYKFGMMKIPYQHANEQDFRRWFGITLEKIPADNDSYWETYDLLNNFYLFRGYPLLNGSINYLLIPQSDVDNLIVHRLWVEMIDGANTYLLDPSFKTSTFISGINLQTAMGYNESTLLSSVTSGATKTADYVQNLNWNNLKSTLGGYANSLLTTFSTDTYKNLTVEEVISGYRINQSISSSLPTTLPFPVVTGTFTLNGGSTKVATDLDWDNIPAAYMSKIRLQVDNVDVTYNFPALKGAKISLTFVSDKARLSLDDVTDQTATTGSGTSASMTVSLNHPFGTWDYANSQVTDNGRYDQTDNGLSYQRAAFAYVIPIGFDDPAGRMRERNEKLNFYLKNGYASNSKEVITEGLYILGLNWIQQAIQIDNVISLENNVLPYRHHMGGRVGYKSGTELSYFVDLPFAFSAGTWRAGDPLDAANPRKKVFNIGSHFLSALEHGVIEQLQNNPSASTISVIHAANLAGKKILRATQSNWSSLITTHLNAEPTNEGYTGPERTAIGNDLNGANDATLLPSNSKIAIGSDWVGMGYAAINETYYFNLMQISGVYNGGFSGTQATFDPEYLNVLWDGEPEEIDSEPSTQPETTGADPVNLRDGSFSLKSAGLVLGQELPRGLNFSRVYNSGKNDINPANMAHGWTHNYIVKARERSDGKAGLGATTPQQMASALVGSIVAYKLYTRTPDATYPHVVQWATAALVSGWTIDQLKDNAVAIQMGGDGLQFVKQPISGTTVTYVPPAGVTSTLTKSSGNYVLQERNGNTLNFDSNKRLSTVVDQYGKTMTFSYDGDGLLSYVRDAYNRQHNFNYTGTAPNKRLSSVTEGDSPSSNLRSVSFGYANTYSTEGDLVSFTDPENKTWTYEYDANHRITKTKDPLTRTIVQNYYDTFGRVEEQRSEGDVGKKWLFLYSDYATTEVNPEGDQKTYFYDGKSRLLGVQNELGKRNWLYYDGQDHLVRQVTPEGDETLFEYNADHNLTKVTDPTLEESTRTYDSDKRLKTVVDFRGKTTTYDYNAKHQVIKITRPNVNNSLANIVEFDYYTADSGTAKAGALRWSEDEDDNRVNFEYDSFGFVNKRTKPSLTLPSGSVNYETFANNYRGDVTSHTDFRNNSTTFQYNKRRQLTQTTAPGTVVTGRTYDDAGNLWKITDPKTYMTEFLYSATGKLLKTKLPQVNGVTPEIESQYDSRDWLEWTENPLDERVTFGYTAAGQTTTVTDDLSRTTTTTYTDNGLRATVTSPLVTPVQTTTYNYNDRGELTSLVDANGKTIGYEYDENGNLKKTTNRRAKNYVNTYYDDGRLATTVTPTSKTTTHAYYKRGLKHTVTEPSTQLTTYTYDAWSQLKTIQDSVTGGTAATLNYDGNGNLITHVEGTKTITRGYDSRNRITSYSYADTANTANNYTLGYQYDDNSNLVGIDYPDSKHVAYEYDEHNRLEAVIDWAGRETRYIYDLAGRNTEVIHHNGTRRKIGYNSTGQTTDIQELDPNGMLIAYFKLNYDSGGRVFEEFIAPIPQSFTEPSRSATYDDDNRIATFNSQTVVHDADGNMTTGPMTNSTLVTYAYDARNRLTSTTSGGGAPALSYGYDQSGNRLTVTQSSQTTRYAVNPVARLSQVLVRTKPDATKTFYVYGLGLLYEADEQERTLTYHYDYRGSTVALTSPAGGVMHRVEYSVYGTITQRSQGGLAIDTPFLFNGKYGVQSDANGLLYMRMRYYNPYLTRFINPDPIGFAGGMNWYMYANGNPVSLVDPFGLAAQGENDSISWMASMIAAGVTTSVEGWLGLIYTGEWFPSAETYDNATTEAGSFLFDNSPLRGFFVGLGFTVEGDKAPFNYLDLGVGGEVSWTMDSGFEASVSFGLESSGSAQTTVVGYGTKPFVSTQMGLGFNLSWGEGGFNGATAEVSRGAGNDLGGYTAGLDSGNQFQFGPTIGSANGGLILDLNRAVDYMNNMFDWMVLGQDNFIKGDE